MKLKVCGLNNRENILEVLTLEPDYIGLIFYKKSPRYIGDLSVTFVSDITSAKKIGVFVNDSEINILDCVARYGLDLVQLHGDESPQFCESIKRRVPVIKAVGVGEDLDEERLRRYEKCADYILFDTLHANRGGSGRAFDHSLLSGLTIALPYFISGGLSNENAQSAFKTDAYAIDVNSKFEKVPGIKDIEKLQLLKQKIYELQR